MKRIIGASLVLLSVAAAAFTQTAPTQTVTLKVQSIAPQENGSVILTLVSGLKATVASGDVVTAAERSSVMTTPAAPATTAPRVTPPPAAAPTAVPSGATARCRDGSYSYSKSRSGTCSGHGGVAQWL